MHNRYLAVPNKNHPILHGAGWFFVCAIWVFWVGKTALPTLRLMKRFCTHAYNSQNFQQALPSGIGCGLFLDLHLFRVINIQNKNGQSKAFYR